MRRRLEQAARGIAFCALALCFSAAPAEDNAAGEDEVQYYRVLAPTDLDRPKRIVIMLDGEPSRGEGQGQLAYQWRQVAGPQVFLSDDHAMRSFFVTQAPGRYEFELIVSMDGLRSDPCRVKVDLEFAPAKPVARAVVRSLDASETEEKKSEALQPLVPYITLPEPLGNRDLSVANLSK